MQYGRRCASLSEIGGLLSSDVADAILMCSMRRQLERQPIPSVIYSSVTAMCQYYATGITEGIGGIPVSHRSVIHNLARTLDTGQS
jgi:hypothetical protein